jgi:hypothetical protein
MKLTNNMIQKYINIICSNLFFVFIFYFIINLPLIVLSWDTGYWSDDYQYLNLWSVKWDISSISRNITDLFEPTSDGHVSPVYYFVNTLVNQFSRSPILFHFLIMLFHVATSLIIFLCVRLTHKNDHVALLAGSFFALSYFITFKALAWSAFHSHVTNTFTGIFSVYLGLKFLSTEKIIYLLYACLLMIATILNYESGFVFPVIIATFTLFFLLNKNTTFRPALNLMIVVSIAPCVYMAEARYFTGSPLPLATKRIMDKLDNKNNSEQDLSEWRSTYGERNIRVMVIRTVDLTLKILNLSFFEAKLKSLLKTYLNKNYSTDKEREQFKNIIRGYAKYVLFTLGGVLALLLPLISYFVYKIISPNTIPYLVNFFAISFVFIVIFNRIDIANSVAIFSSVVFADMILTLISNNGLKKKFGLGLLVFLLFMPTLIFLDKFDGLYEYSFANKRDLRIHWKLAREINLTVGRYTEDAIVFFYPNKQRSATYWFFPAPVDKKPFQHVDLSHLNVRMFQEDFKKTKEAALFSSKSFNQSTELVRDHFITIAAKSKNEVYSYLEKNSIDPAVTDIVYVDESLSVQRI